MKVSIGLLFLTSAVSGWQLKPFLSTLALDNARKLSVFSASSLLFFFSAVHYSDPFFPQSIAHADDAPLYGLSKDRLLKCKAKSNCVSSSSVTSLEKYGRPWDYSSDSSRSASDIIDQIVTILKKEGLSIENVDKDKFYVHAVGKSGFSPTGEGIDDLEFLLIDQDKIITYRSNSRDVLIAGPQVIGDAGFSKKRLARVQNALGYKEMGMTKETEQYIKKEENLLYFQRLREMSKPNDINFLDNSVPDSTAKKD